MKKKNRNDEFVAARKKNTYEELKIGGARFTWQPDLRQHQQQWFENVRDERRDDDVIQTNQETNEFQWKHLSSCAGMHSFL